MSFLDRIREANCHDPSAFVPLTVDRVRIGSVRPAFAARLAEHPGVFAVDDSGVALTAPLDRASLEERSEAVGAVLLALREAGAIRGWRSETFPVATAWGAPPALLVERAAVPHLGVGGVGVHLNGWVRRGREVHMWVARRAEDKPTWPGLLDQLAAGGQPVGIGLRENMLKEAEEEAGVARSLASRMRPVGIVTYVFETAEGLRPDVVFAYDLELPESFVPHNTDGEVSGFELLPIEEVAAIVRDGKAFKFNCALVVIDFLVRHGHIEESDPDYVAIVQGLRAGRAVG